ncbi:RHOMBOID-like protein 9, chloroplastic [Cynara cardunculus var. scolymus]|uniref:RHOMBOID-like protein 9, chloroplastic n=1 Tax=Cynara cardunculus var. scolymus TaxID=59895 RepID=UPI000D62B532|nr:RHOMBOID-like protein 9, chloroplastic [Cynara cardunculus var. scolymus]
MALVPVCFKMCYEDQIVNKGACFIPCTTDQDVFGGISPVSNHRVKTVRFCYNSVGNLMKPKYTGMVKSANHLRSISASASERERLSRFAIGSSSREKQLRSLDSYFRKSKNDRNQPSPSSFYDDGDAHSRSAQSTDQRGLGPVGESLGQVLDRSGQFNAERELSSVDEHLKLDRDLVSSATKEETSHPTLNLVKNGQGTQAEVDDQGGSKSDYDETSGLYIISTMASINIAVYLFEIASPVRNSDLELFSIPALYGAKINHLILYGEWWRLLTSMFLHTGIVHIGLGCWVLLTFGPQVCRVYGRFTFFLIYILGGLSGNFTSFLHTPDPTVGGTGPVFAIIGAWLIYQYQNKDATGKDVYENMYQKAILATALGFVLSSFGPIDEWSHFGSVFTGIAYGFFTCPTLQIDDSSSQKTGKDDGIRLIGRNVDPCKSLLLFSIFVLVLSSLFIITEPPLGSVALDTLL